MENSEQQKKLLNLGKQLVKELASETRYDTLSRWMAHYLAEKIEKIEKLPDGSEKDLEQKDCRDTILRLWQHRWSLPPGKVIFQEFEPILRLLENLMPESRTGYYWNRSANSTLENLAKEPGKEALANCLSAIKTIDATARICIEYLLTEAASTMADEKTREFIKNSADLSNSEDAEIIRIVIRHGDNSKNGDDDIDEFAKQYAIEKVANRIDELKRFRILTDGLLKSYEDELGGLQKI